jgi:hypothetical protein
MCPWFKHCDAHHNFPNYIKFREIFPLLLFHLTCIGGKLSKVIFQPWTKNLTLPWRLRFMYYQPGRRKFKLQIPKIALTWVWVTLYLVDGFVWNSEKLKQCQINQNGEIRNTTEKYKHIDFSIISYYLLSADSEAKERLKPDIQEPHVTAFCDTVPFSLKLSVSQQRKLQSECLPPWKHILNVNLWWNMFISSHCWLLRWRIYITKMWSVLL